MQKCDRQGNVIDGTLKVTPRPITITVLDAERVYNDGEDVTDEVIDSYRNRGFLILDVPYTVSLAIFR